MEENIVIQLLHNSQLIFGQKNMSNEDVSTKSVTLAVVVITKPMQSSSLFQFWLVG